MLHTFELSQLFVGTHHTLKTIEGSPYEALQLCVDITARRSDTLT